MIRLGQVLLVVAALGLWVAGRLTWVVLRSSDGLGQPKTVTLTGSSWSTALLPVALLLLAAAVATLAVRGWPLRVLSLLLAAVSAAIAYLGISQWVVPDVAVRAADIVGIPVASLVGSERQYVGAMLTLAAGVVTLAAAVLLIRAGSAGRSAAGRYAAPGARRSAAREPVDTAPTGQTPSTMSERKIWDALDEGLDPTAGDSGSEPGPPAEGR